MTLGIHNTASAKPVMMISRAIKMPPTIFIPAGEASGEYYGALVIDALKKRLAASGQLAQFFGMGGQPLVYGQSITDPCIDWKETHSLLAELAAAVRARRRV